MLPSEPLLVVVLCDSLLHTGGVNVPPQLVQTCREVAAAHYPSPLHAAAEC